MLGCDDSSDVKWIAVVITRAAVLLPRTLPGAIESFFTLESN